MNDNMITRGKITNLQKAYLAGFIDGEGCICIYAGGTPKRINPNKYSRIELAVYLYNTHKDTMLWVQEVFGGRMKGRHFNHPVWQPSYIIKWSSNQARDILEMVVSYMHTKKAQAELAIKFQKNRKNGTSRFSPTTPEQWEFAQRCAEEMRNLNTGNRPQRLIEKTPAKVM